MKIKFKKGIRKAVFGFACLLYLLISACAPQTPEAMASNEVTNYLEALKEGTGWSYSILEDETGLESYLSTEYQTGTGQEFFEQYRQALFHDWTLENCYVQDEKVVVLITLETLDPSCFSWEQISNSLYKDLCSEADQIKSENSQISKEELANQLEEYSYSILEQKLENPEYTSLFLKFVVDMNTNRIESIE